MRHRGVRVQIGHDGKRVCWHMRCVGRGHGDGNVSHGSFFRLGTGIWSSPEDALGMRERRVCGLETGSGEIVDYFLKPKGIVTTTSVMQHTLSPFEIDMSVCELARHLTRLDVPSRCP